MEEWFAAITKGAIIVIDSMALVVVFAGTVEAFVRSGWFILRPSPADQRFRIIWVRYARWLVAGLTFQLAADIIETAIAPGWMDIGRLAAIAVIRTFLNFFLERDLTEVTEQKLSLHNAAHPQVEGRHSTQAGGRINTTATAPSDPLHHSN